MIMFIQNFTGKRSKVFLSSSSIFINFDSVFLNFMFQAKCFHSFEMAQCTNSWNSSPVAVCDRSLNPPITNDDRARLYIYQTNRFCLEISCQHISLNSNVRFKYTSWFFSNVLLEQQ